MAYIYRKSDQIIRALLTVMACYAPGLLAQTCCPQPCWGQGFIEGEFLYWRAYQGGLSNCVSQEETHLNTDGDLISRFKGKKQDPHFKWSPGFRVGAGYQL